MRTEGLAMTTEPVGAGPRPAQMLENWRSPARVWRDGMLNNGLSKECPNKGLKPLVVKFYVRDDKRICRGRPRDPTGAGGQIDFFAAKTMAL